jgi:hypothetical protein
VSWSKAASFLANFRGRNDRDVSSPPKRTPQSCSYVPSATFFASSKNCVKMTDLIRRAIRLATDPENTRWICPLLFAGDAVLSTGVLWKIPCAYIRA